MYSKTPLSATTGDTLRVHPNSVQHKGGMLLTIGAAVLSGIGKGLSLSSPATLSVALDGGPA